MKDVVWLVAFGESVANATGKPEKLDSLAEVTEYIEDVGKELGYANPTIFIIARVVKKQMVSGKP